MPVGNRRLRAQIRRLRGAEHTAHLLAQELAVLWQQLEACRAELLQARSQADPARWGGTRDTARAARQAMREQTDLVR